MRTREEIVQNDTKSKPDVFGMIHIGKSHDEIVLELLLDIRDLLSRT